MVVACFQGARITSAERHGEGRRLCISEHGAAALRASGIFLLPSALFFTFRVMACIARSRQYSRTSKPSETSRTKSWYQGGKRWLA